MKTFQFNMKRFQFSKNEEKGTLFCFSTLVEKCFSGFYSKISAVIA